MNRLMTRMWFSVCLAALMCALNGCASQSDNGSALSQTQNVPEFAALTKPAAINQPSETGSFVIFGHGGSDGLLVDGLDDYIARYGLAGWRRGSKDTRWISKATDRVSPATLPSVKSFDETVSLGHRVRDFFVAKYVNLHPEQDFRSYFDQKATEATKTACINIILKNLGDH